MRAPGGNLKERPLRLPTRLRVVSRRMIYAFPRGKSRFALFPAGNHDSQFLPCKTRSFYHRRTDADGSTRVNTVKMHLSSSRRKRLARLERREKHEARIATVNVAAPLRPALDASPEIGALLRRRSAEGKP